jgi:hypothetical protein
LSGEGPGDVVGLNSPARLHLTVENDGNLTATGIRLEITLALDEVIQLDPRFACSRETTLVCTLPSLAAQSSTRIDFNVSTEHPGLLKTQFAVTADQPDNSRFLNTLELDQNELPVRDGGDEARRRPVRHDRPRLDLRPRRGGSHRRARRERLPRCGLRRRHRPRRSRA